MDNIILHFINVETSLVVSTITELGVAGRSFENGEGLYFYWDEYTNQELHTEYEVEEKKLLFQLLGGEPECSFSLSSRHGEHAREALRFIVDLLSHYPHCIIDDDHGGLWNYNEMLNHYQSSNEATIYSIRIEP